MAKGYVVAEVQVSNPLEYEPYKALSTSTVAAHGGRFIVRGGVREQCEGQDAQHNGTWRTVIIEFPTLAAARGWYESAEYAEAKEIRFAHSTGRLFLVEGVEAG